MEEEGKLNKAAPVEVTNEEPLAVKVQDSVPVAVRMQAVERNAESDQRTDETARVKASAKVDSDILMSEGQRKINSIWERTQQLIALSVVEVALAVAAYKSFISADTDPSTASVAFVFLASVANLVIGFYFGRTNHQKIGGVGPDSENIAGR